MIYNKRVSCHSPELHVIRHIYETSFPRDERREFDLLLRLLVDEPSFSVDAIYKDDKVVGLITSWHFVDWYYIEHFAIDEKERGTGIGRVVLQNFITETRCPIILEVEPPTDTQSRRRIAFYRSLGFTLHENYPYIQPPYSDEQSAVELLLMSHGKDKNIDLDLITNTLHRRIYGII